MGQLGNFEYALDVIWNEHLQSGKMKIIDLKKQVATTKYRISLLFKKYKYCMYVLKYCIDWGSYICLDEEPVRETQFNADDLWVVEII